MGDAMIRWMHDFPTGSHIATRDRRTSPKNEARILNLLQTGDTDRLAQLFTHGTDPNLIIRAQLKPPHNCSLKLSLPLLHIAASNNYLYVAECLLDHGADVDGRDEYGTSAVHWAAAAGHLKMLHLLRRRAADMDCADKLGMTPLHIAAHAGRTRAITVLLKAGADCAAQSRNGELALDLARKQKNGNCQRALHRALSARAAQREIWISAEEDVVECEHDRSATMVVHGDHSPMFVATPATPENEEESENENENSIEVGDEESALEAKSEELRAHVRSLRAETKRLKEITEEHERQRMFEVEQERQLNRSLEMSERQKERSLLRQRQRSKSRSKSRGKSRSKSRSRKAKAKKEKVKESEDSFARAQRLKSEAKKRRRERKAQAKEAANVKGKVNVRDVLAQRAFVRWLDCEVALPMYAQLFMEKGCDRLEAVKGLDSNKLRRMGVKKFRDREVFVREIRKLCEAESASNRRAKRLSFSRQMSL